MAVDNIRNEIAYQRENQTNIERAGNWLTDSGFIQALNDSNQSVAVLQTLCTTKP